VLKFNGVVMQNKKIASAIAGLALLKILSSDPAHAENPALWRYYPNSSNVGWIRPYYYYPPYYPYSYFQYDSRGYRIYINDGTNYIYIENRTIPRRFLSDYEAGRVIEKYFKANDFDFERNVDVGPTNVDYVLRMRIKDEVNIGVEYLSPEEGGKAKKELLSNTPIKGIHYVLTIDKNDEAGIIKQLDNGIKKIIDIESSKSNF